MILGIETEFTIFLQALLSGNLLCLIYTAIKILRKIIPHKAFFRILEDWMYWGFAGIHLFLKLQENCSGNIRWYFVMGLLGGSLITYNFIRKFAGKYVDKSGKRE